MDNLDKLDDWERDFIAANPKWKYQLFDDRKGYFFRFEFEATIDVMERLKQYVNDNI